MSELRFEYSNFKFITPCPYDKKCMVADYSCSKCEHNKGVVSNASFTNNSHVVNGFGTVNCNYQEVSKLNYASDYSHKLWCKLMKQFRKDENYSIGANDVSDFVLNAIIDALNNMSYENLNKYFPENIETGDCNNNSND